MLSDSFPQLIANSAFSVPHKTLKIGLITQTPAPTTNGIPIPCGSLSHINDLTIQFDVKFTHKLVNLDINVRI